MSESGLGFVRRTTEDSGSLLREVVMKRPFALALVSGLLVVSGWPSLSAQEGTFLVEENGDVNGDGRRDLSDAVAMLNWLFLSGPPPARFDASTRVDELESALSFANDRIRSLEERVLEVRIPSAGATNPAVYGRVCKHSIVAIRVHVNSADELQLRIDE